ncbi:MAG: type II toxin-antitoxin system HicA family toxin [Candidatus Roizmanbacteria bacterium]
MPAINSKKLLQFLKKKGFYIHHQVGSHIVLKHESDEVKRVTLPMHNTDLKLGTLNSILKQAGLTKTDLFGK